MHEKTKYRYPGLYAYEKEDADIFKGRTEDAEKLFTHIKLNKTLVLHAESGIGKSSLLRAGLLPLLEKSDTNYVISIINLSDIKDDNSADLLIREVINGIIKENPSTLSIQTYLLEGVQNSLWSLSKKLELEGKTLVLAFDQFESLLNFNADQIEFFKRQLFEMLDLKIPENVYSQIEPIIDAVQTDTEITKKVNASYQFLIKPGIAKVVFIIREDKLGVMSNLSDLFPDILKNDFTISALSTDNAKKALVEPAQLEDIRFISNSFQFESTKNVDDLIEKIADKNLVDPVQLQIVAQNFERKIILQEGVTPAERKEKKVINEADIPAIGNIIDAYYKDRWTELRDNLHLSAKEIADLKYKLISQLVVGGQRALVISYSVEIDPNSCKIISELTKIGFLRKIPGENRTVYYQLSHDRLMIPISEDLKDYKDRQEKLQLEEQDKKNKEELLIRAAQLESEKRLKEEAVDARRIAEQAQKRAKKLSITVAVLGILFGIIGWWLITKANNEHARNKNLVAQILVNQAKAKTDEQDIYASLSLLMVAKELSPNEVGDSLVESFNNHIFKGIVFRTNDDGKIVYNIRKDSTLTIWDISQTPFKLLTRFSKVRGFESDKTGYSFAIVNFDSIVEVYNRENGIYKKSLSFKSENNQYPSISTLEFSKNGATVAFRDISNSLRIFSFQGVRAIPYINTQLLNKNFSSFYISDDGNKIVLVDSKAHNKKDKNNIIIYDLRQKNQEPIFKTAFFSINFSQDDIYNNSDTFFYTDSKKQTYLVDVNSATIIPQKLDINFENGQIMNHFIVSLPFSQYFDNLIKLKDSTINFYDIRTKNRFTITVKDLNLRYQYMNYVDEKKFVYLDTALQIKIIDLKTNKRDSIVNKMQKNGYGSYDISEDGNMITYRFKDSIFVKNLVNGNGFIRKIATKSTVSPAYPLFINKNFISFYENDLLDGFSRCIALIKQDSSANILKIYPQTLTDSIRQFWGLKKRS